MHGDGDVFGTRNFGHFLVEGFGDSGGGCCDLVSVDDKRRRKKGVKN